MGLLNNIARDELRAPDALIRHISNVYRNLVNLDDLEIQAHGPSHPKDRPKKPRKVVVTGKGLRTASSNKEQGIWLTKLVNHIASKQKGPITVLELGTCVGISGMYLLSALERNFGGNLITFEGSPELARIAELNMDSLMQEHNFNKTTYSVQVGGIDTMLPDWLKEDDGQIHIAFVDGNHQEKSTVNYHRLIREKMHKGGLIIHDDINWGDGMAKAWSTVCELEKPAEIGELHLGGSPSRGIIFLETTSSDQVEIVHLDRPLERTLRKFKRSINKTFRQS